MTLSDQLRADRLRCALSVPQAAALAEVATRTWRQWEAGERAPQRASVLLFRHRAGLERVPFGGHS